MIFSPTNKQLEAIEKMETFSQIKSHRVHFESKEEFDKYFELLQKKWKKRKKLLDSISDWKTNFSEINKKKEKRKQEYYSDYENLRTYAIKYIWRYYPTIWQLQNQLNKKNPDQIIIWKVINDLKHLIDEEKMIETFVSNLLFRWKNINYIQTKLYNKKFNSDLIKIEIDKLKSWWTLLNEYKLEEKIKNYIEKGRNKSEIRIKFTERREDKKLIEKIIEKVFPEDLEREILKNKIEELKRKKIPENKIIQRLIWRGFKYDDIKKEIEK